MFVAAFSWIPYLPQRPQGAQSPREKAAPAHLQVWCLWAPGSPLPADLARASPPQPGGCPSSQRLCPTCSSPLPQISVSLGILHRCGLSLHPFRVGGCFAGVNSHQVVVNVPKSLRVVPQRSRGWALLLGLRGLGEVCALQNGLQDGKASSLEWLLLSLC